MSFFYYNYYIVYEFDFQTRMAEIRKSFRRFLAKLARVQWHPNPLPILARAVNSVRCRFHIRQPCWRSNRWKSLT